MIGHVRRIVLVAGKKRDYRQTRARAEKPRVTDWQLRGAAAKTRRW